MLFNEKIISKKTLLNARIGRVLIFFGSAFILTYFFFLSFAMLTAQEFTVDLDANSDNINTRMSVSDFYEHAKVFVDIPVLQLNFWIYAKNEIYFKSQYPWLVNSYLNIDITGQQYTDKIETGTSKKILDLTLNDLRSTGKNLVINRSIKSAPFDAVSLKGVRAAGSSSFSIYLWPTNPSFFVVFLISIGITYALLIFIAGCWKFVWYGEPFN